jgi:hypothetical protein
MKKPTNKAKAISAGESSTAILPPFAWLDSIYNRFICPRYENIYDLPILEIQRKRFKFAVIVLLLAMATAGGCSL